MKEYYKIKSEALVSIADAIRSKKETTAVFTPEQMATEIESIVTGDNLLNAENNYFGSSDSDSEYEYGITDYGTKQKSWYSTTSLYYGYRFTANDNFAVSGFRHYKWNVQTVEFQLWDCTAESVIAEMTVKETANEEFVEHILPSPVNLISGNQYAVVQKCSVQAPAFAGSQYAAVNNKITVDMVHFRSSGVGSYTKNDNTLSAVDILIDDILTESVITEYLIQKETLDALADVVRSYKGIRTKLTPDEMIATLQSIQLQDKSVTPTAEIQTITPDDGYYGLSSVTVGTVTEENEAVIEIINEKMEVVANDTY